MSDTDTQGTAIQLEEILNQEKVKGKILAIGDSARDHAILNLKYFKENSDITECVGINCDPKAIGNYNHFNIVLGNGNKMNYPNDTFDMVLSIMLFEHDLFFWKTVDEIKRVLKPGGLFITAVPCFEDRISKEYNDGTITYMLHEAPNVDDYYRFSEKAIIKFFYSEFSNIQVRKYQQPPRLLVTGRKFQDELSFIKSLPYSPEGHWNMQHKIIVEYVRDFIKPKTMMEIGLNSGFSTALWLYTLLNVKLHSIDIGIHPFISDVQNKFKSYFGNRFTYETMDSKNLHDKIYPVYDMIMIDGGHKEDVCMSDMMFALTHSKYILLDDTAGGSPGVTSALSIFMKKFPNRLVLLKKWNVRSGCQLYQVV